MLKYTTLLSEELRTSCSHSVLKSYSARNPHAFELLPKTKDNTIGRHSHQFQEDIINYKRNNIYNGRSYSQNCKQIISQEIDVNRQFQPQ